MAKLRSGPVNPVHHAPFRPEERFPIQHRAEENNGEAASEDMGGSAPRRDCAGWPPNMTTQTLIQIHVHSLMALHEALSFSQHAPARLP